MSLINLSKKQTVQIKLLIIFSGKDTTYFYTKIILDTLNGQILAQRAKLVIYVLVVGLSVVPL